MSKRPNDDTEAIVRDTLEAEEREKRARKQGQSGNEFVFFPSRASFFPFLQPFLTFFFFKLLPTPNPKQEERPSPPRITPTGPERSPP